MSEICYEPSQIFQPSKARAAPSWLGPPIRLLRSCPVFDALGVGLDVLPVLKHREDVKYHHAALGQSETYPSAPANP